MNKQNLESVNSKQDTLGEKVKIVHPEGRQEMNECLYLEDLKYPLNIYMAGISIWESGVKIIRHNSTFFNFEFITGGQVLLEQDGRSYLVNPGQMYILRKRSDHSYATGPCGYAHKRFLFIAGDALGSILSNLGLSDVDVVTLKDPNQFARYLKSAIRILKKREPGFLAELSKLAYQILLSLGSQMVDPKYPASIRSLLDYMRQHQNRLVSLREFAKVAGMSVPHFCRIFQKHFSMAPMTYFRSMKMKYARQLLHATTLNIKEISRELGYDDTAHFSNFFLREEGVPPSLYRKKIKQTG